jgi:ribosome recycling factor
MNLVQQHKQQFDKAIEYFKQDITSLRTGRATPALVEDIVVEAYGMKQPVKAVASISVLDAKTLQVAPWDKSVLGDLERGLRNSDLGINPVNDGTVIRLPLPELTTERRQELIKVLHAKLEQARIAVRKVREEVRNAIDKAEKAKEISEDERYTFQESLDKMVKEYNDLVKKIGEEKEADILKV